MDLLTAQRLENFSNHSTIRVHIPAVSHQQNSPARTFFSRISPQITANFSLFGHFILILSRSFVVIFAAQPHTRKLEYVNFLIAFAFFNCFHC